MGENYPFTHLECRVQVERPGASLVPVDAGRAADRPGLPGPARYPPSDAADQTDRLRITALEYAELYGVDASTAYREIRDGVRRLYERSIKITRPDGREDHFRWIWSRSAHQRAGYVEISFTPDLAQYVTALKGKFTSYGLDQVRHLRSPNAVRIFELMMQWRGTGVARVTLADLRSMLQLTYQRFTDVRRFVLDPAVQQISEHTHFDTTWRPVRVGRQVESIEFCFTERRQGTLPLCDQARSPEDTDALIPMADDDADLTPTAAIEEP